MIQEFTNVNDTTREYLNDVITEMKDTGRRSWKLLQVFEKYEELKKLRKAHHHEMKKVPRKNMIFCTF